MIHRDLKTPNILLDEHGNVKVADFGTVRAGVTQQGAGNAKNAATHTLTGAAVGTQGYMPPEYITQGQVSEKLDMYSFAVVLIELMTSKTGIEVAGLHCGEPEMFAEMSRFVDARAGKWPVAIVAALAAIAEQCISYYASVRPPAREVIPKLEVLLL
jgi:serine/threonine protein kinase